MNESFKILLVRSGGHFIDTDFPDAPMIAPPRGLLQLAGIFKEDPGVECRLLDALVYPDLKQVKEDRRNPPFYFGMPEDQIVEQAREFSPQVIALTSTANYYINDTIRLMELLHRHIPQAFLVVGGPDATNDYPVYFQKSRAFQAIVLREGEETFRELIHCLKEDKDWKNIQGIVYSQEDTIHRNPDRPYIQDLDNYPCDYSIVDFPQYFHITKLGYPSRLNYKYPGSHHSIDIVTSRGCSHDCSFCCIHLHMGREFRVRSPENVLEEMEELITRYDVRNFHFEDDNLLCHKKRFKDILKGIIHRDWNITWDTPNGVRADLIDEELLQLCRQSGCTYLVFGIESGSKKVLDNIVKKGINLEDYRRACELCWNYEIDTMAFFIFGMPGETKEDLLKTYYFAMDLFEKYNATPIFQLWRPYRNTEMEMELRESDCISEPMLYNLFKELRIPYTLFYSRVYEDQEITLEFIAYYFQKYLKDTVQLAFKNWRRVARGRPGMYLSTLFRISGIFVSSLFAPSRTRKRLQLYLSSSGLLPFSQRRRLGTSRAVKTPL